MINIILSQKADRDALPARGTIARDGLAAARESLESGLIKVVTGPRRAGKSVFAVQMLQGREYAYVNFDDERLAGLKDFDDLLMAMAQVYGETRTFFLDQDGAGRGGMLRRGATAT